MSHKFKYKITVNRTVAQKGQYVLKRWHFDIFMTFLSVSTLETKPSRRHSHSRYRDFRSIRAGCRRPRTHSKQSRPHIKNTGRRTPLSGTHPRRPGRHIRHSRRHAPKSRRYSRMPGKCLPDSFIRQRLGLIRGRGRWQCIRTDFKSLNRQFRFNSKTR